MAGSTQQYLTRSAVQLHLQPTNFGAGVVFMWCSRSALCALLPGVEIKATMYTFAWWEVKLPFRL